MQRDLRSIDPKACTGCRICELVCSLHHYGVINPKRSRIRVYRVEDRHKIRTCRHCPERKCVAACPTGALTIVGERVVVERGKCDLCGKCVEACPMPGSLRIFDGELLRCDLCGGNPACARHCIAGAISLVSKP